MKKPMPPKPSKTKMRMGAPVRKAASGGIMGPAPRPEGNGALPVTRFKYGVKPTGIAPRPEGNGALPVTRYKFGVKPTGIAPRPEGNGALPVTRFKAGVQPPVGAPRPRVKKDIPVMRPSADGGPTAKPAFNKLPRTGGELPAFRRGGSAKKGKG